MTRHADRVARFWGSPVPEGLKHGRNTFAAQCYGCDCSLCLPSGQRRRIREDRPLTTSERQRRSRANLKGTPVPEGTLHGAYTYRIYGCRCDLCIKAKAAEHQRLQNAWRATARGVWTELGESVILHWKPATAGPDWICPDCHWAPESE